MEHEWTFLHVFDFFINIPQMLTETPQFPYFKADEQKPKRKRTFSIKLRQPNLMKNPVLLKMFPPPSQSLDLKKKKEFKAKDESEQEKVFKYLYLKQKLLFEQIIKSHGITEKVDDE